MPVDRTGTDSRIDEAVVAFQTGLDREESFTFIVEHFYPRLEGFLRGRGVSERIRGDILQEVFLQVLLGLDGFERRSSLATWIFALTRNVLHRLTTADHRFRLANEEEIEESAREVAGWPDEDIAKDRQLVALLSKERQEHLREAIETLPEQMRFCLQMRLYQDRSYAEIAAALRISSGTVGAHINEAKRRLTELLRAEEADRREAR